MLPKKQEGKDFKIPPLHNHACLAGTSMPDCLSNPPKPRLRADVIAPTAVGRPIPFKHAHHTEKVCSAVARVAVNFKIIYCGAGLREAFRDRTRKRRACGCRDWLCERVEIS